MGKEDEQFGGKVSELLQVGDCPLCTFVIALLYSQHTSLIETSSSFLFSSSSSKQVEERMIFFLNPI